MLESSLRYQGTDQASPLWSANFLGKLFSNNYALSVIIFLPTYKLKTETPEKF